MISPDPALLLANRAKVRGVGTDIVEIAEFRRLPFDQNRAFYEKTFTSGEIGYCLGFADCYERFAARFAAKEAVIKAFGGEILLDQIEIEVSNQANGQPTVKVHAAGLEGTQVLISLSHSPNYALAFAAVIQE